MTDLEQNFEKSVSNVFVRHIFETRCQPRRRCLMRKLFLTICRKLRLSERRPKFLAPVSGWQIRSQCPWTISCRCWTFWVLRARPRVDEKIKIWKIEFQNHCRRFVVASKTFFVLGRLRQFLTAEGLLSRILESSGSKSGFPVKVCFPLNLMVKAVHDFLF